jgi:hypothetical protein
MIPIKYASIHSLAGLVQQKDRPQQLLQAAFLGFSV